jgi:hydroxypyruvate isomerase
MSKLSVCIEMVFADHPIEKRIQLAAETGANAIEFWGWKEKDLDEIERVCENVGMDISAMIGSDTPLTDPDQTERAVIDIQESIETAEEYDCSNLIITVGHERDDISRREQHNSIVNVLSQVAPEAERADVALGVEPLNTAVDHPDYYLNSSEEAFEIVNSVDSSAVGVLFDVYHQQITEGDVTRRLIDQLEDVSHVHIADNPGRQEPGTGELNYENILTTLIQEGYEDYVGCEFRPAGDHKQAIERCEEFLNQ